MTCDPGSGARLCRALLTCLVLCSAVPLVQAEELGIARLEFGPSDDSGAILIRSRDARQQLTVTVVHTNDSRTDVTRQAVFTVSGSEVLGIDGTGLALPKADGEVDVVATVGDKSATLKIKVTGFAEPLPRLACRR